MRLPGIALGVVGVLAVSGFLPAEAQPLGTFSWQQLPYCNVVQLDVVQAGAVYHLDGFDGQCGAAARAGVSGLAFPNPDGTIGFGLTIVTTPGGAPLHVDATITLAALSGTWRDSAGNTGAWVFTPGSGVAGPPRPIPSVGSSQPITAYSAAILSGAQASDRGCLSFDAGGGLLRLGLPLPVGASVTGIRVKYRDSSPNDMQFTVIATDFPDGGTSTDTSAFSFLSSNGTNGTRLETRTFAAAAVSATRNYYLTVFGPLHTGELSFCGAEVLFTTP